MKSKTIIWLFLLITTNLVSQSNGIKFSKGEIIIGNNFLTHQEIKATQFLFPKRIHKIDVDTISNYATLTLRKLSKNGKHLDIYATIVIFDLNNNQVKWSKKIEYPANYIQQFNNIIIQSNNNKIFRLNIEDGSKMWTTKSDLYYVNPKLQIGLGYKYNGLTGNIHTLEGIDLITGASLWQNILNRQYGWNKIQRLNDSIVLITTGGLHSINIKNGNGWHYNTVTGKKDYKETIAKNAAGIALGIATGTFITSSGPSLVSNIDSNTLINNNNVYFASKDSISKIDLKTGSIIWSNPLPKDLTSSSSIFLRDSILYMINKGYAFWGRKMIPFGQPFMLALNKDNGRQIYFINNFSKENSISDFEIKNDTLFLLFKEKLSKHLISTGMKLNEKQFTASDSSKLYSFIGNNLYTKTKDSVFIKLKQTDSTKIYVYKDNNKIIALDTHLNTLNELESDQVFYNYLNYDDYIFLGKKNQTIILDKNNHKIATLGVSYRSFFIKNKLFDFQDNGLLVVDLFTQLKQN